MSRIAQAAVALALVALPVASAHADTIPCPGNIINRTVLNVVVAGNCVIRNSTVDGNIEVKTGGNLTVIGSTIKGSVQSEGANRVRLLPYVALARETVVIGDVQIKDMAPSTLVSVIQEAEIGGTILLDTNAAPINVLANQVKGDVQLFQNTRRIVLRDNIIDGNLQCTSNRPRPVNGGGNVVEGNAENQCAGYGN
jgi:hypothetical protein